MRAAAETRKETEKIRARLQSQCREHHRERRSQCRARSCAFRPRYRTTLVRRVAGVTRLRDRRRQPDGFDLGEVNLLRGMIDVEPNDIAVAIEIDEGAFDNPSDFDPGRTL